MKEAEIRNYLAYNISEGKILPELHFQNLRQQLKTSSNAFG